LSDELPGALVVIAVGDSLYRRLPRETVRLGRVTRGAYYVRGEPDPAVSVDLARLTTPEETRLRAPRPERFGIGALPARIPIELGLRVRHDPLPDNPAHCLIEGATTRAICQSLADDTTIVIALPLGEPDAVTPGR
jgi:hypothetical protein